MIPPIERSGFLRSRVGRLALCLALCAMAMGCREEGRKPNFLFVVVDDLGYRDLGFMGSSF